LKAKITVLCENSVAIPFGVIGEHGFSCFIETDNGNYLFDTGQGMGILQNAFLLKKDLQSIESISLSHGHYDHTGGLPPVLRQRGKVDVFAHPDVFVERVWENEETSRYIGIPYRRRFLESLGANFILDRAFSEIGPGIFLTGEVPRITSFEIGDRNMSAFERTGKKVHPDPLADDISMVLDTDSGLIIILGCAHAGTVNIIRHVTEKTGKKEIYAIIGGTHLGFCTDEQFTGTLDAFREYGVKKIGVSHCTGQANSARLFIELKERFFFGSVGAVLEG
jgi:7,8-dihydropterin-6-yl-methyl-4-(beta-D-ribofuranosyl)aminobenzene 5'-phosphate synthase